jgi:hypothetical protein
MHDLGGSLVVSHESTDVRFFAFGELEELTTHESIRRRIEDYLMAAYKQADTELATLRTVSIEWIPACRARFPCLSHREGTLQGLAYQASLRTIPP